MHLFCSLIRHQVEEYLTGKIWIFFQGIPIVLYPSHSLFTLQFSDPLQIESNVFSVGIWSSFSVPHYHSVTRNLQFNSTYLLYCRFSSDLYMIDDSLPFILNILLANFVGLLGIAVVLSCVQVLEKNKSSLWCYAFLEV